MTDSNENQPSLLTIGHSARTLPEFTNLLQSNGVDTLVDVRSSPGSKFAPQFNKETLSKHLKVNGINYVHIPELGGHRTIKKGTTTRDNSAWDNSSFRSYADFMHSPEFEKGMSKLKTLMGRGQCAIMCAESVPWRCHRSLISDVMIANDVPVYDIVSKAPPKRATLRSFAVVNDKKQVSYPKSGVVPVPPGPMV